MLVSVTKDPTTLAGRHVRLPDLRNNSAQKWRLSLQVGVLQEPADPAFSSAPAAGCNVHEDCAQICASALGPAYCQAIGPSCTLLTSSSARSEGSVVETGAFSRPRLEN